MRADADDLIWYDSMEELKEDGAQCVAVMMEVRNVSNDGTLGSDRSQMNHLHMFVHGKNLIHEIPYTERRYGYYQ